MDRLRGANRWDVAGRICRHRLCSGKPRIFHHFCQGTGGGIAADTPSHRGSSKEPLRRIRDPKTYCKATGGTAVQEAQRVRGYGCGAGPSRPGFAVCLVIRFDKDEVPGLVLRI